MNSSSDCHNIDLIWQTLSIVLILLSWSVFCLTSYPVAWKAERLAWRAIDYKKEPYQTQWMEPFVTHDEVCSDLFFCLISSGFILKTWLTFLFFEIMCHLWPNYLLCPPVSHYLPCLNSLHLLHFVPLSLSWCGRTCAQPQ